MNATMRLTRAQQALLRSASNRDLILSGRERRTASILQDKGLVVMVSRDPYTWAHANRPRVWTARTTDLGKTLI